ncbi:MAG TPA: hypothetical protein VHT91_06860 [Kofleriaceae bacterium]|jgi:hypothetical protein|nr:hypothetical protein [Kofleriaceae bacterium]
MKRSLVFAVAVLVGMFVGTAALQVQAATTSARHRAAVVQQQQDVQADDSASPGYWAIWAEAASH